MKVLVMGFTKIKYMPYMNFYLENIDGTSNDVHLLYWNRDLKEEDVSALEGITLHAFCHMQQDEVSKLSKIGSFNKYRNFAIDVLDREKFDFIVVLHSLPGVLLYNKLQKEFRGRYIFDYRDSTYEAFLPFKRIIGRLVKGSKATFVSSDAFRRFLPESEKHKIFTSHNILMDSLSHRDEKKSYGKLSNRIRIAFWGMIRHEEINREIIRKVAEDERFELHYYGREQQIALNLKTYVNQIQANNIFFHGEYKPEDRYEFVCNTDIIHNIYKDTNTMLAMGNKYYDAIVFYLPLMSMCGSFMADAAEKAHIGFNVNPFDDNFLNGVYEHYSNLDKQKFEENCDKELERIILEYESGCNVIRECI